LLYTINNKLLIKQTYSSFITLLLVEIRGVALG